MGTQKKKTQRTWW